MRSVSVYVPPRKPTPRSTCPGPAVTLALTSGNAGSPGLVSTPTGPTRWVAVIEWEGAECTESIDYWLFDMKRGSRGRDTMLSLT